MKIKKINEDKVQIIITNQDLEERDFKKWELMPISPKAQELFQDLLDMAYQECGFEIEDDSQLMVEAYPLSVDSFAVVMTKMRADRSKEQLNIIVPQRDDEERNESLNERGQNQVWRFASLEECCLLCARIISDYIEESVLYKWKGNHYLALSILPETQVEIEAILGEYGEWAAFDEAYLKEYGELIIERAAVANLASLIR